jgi:hypothetical protein
MMFYSYIINILKLVFPRRSLALLLIGTSQAKLKENKSEKKNNNIQFIILAIL